MYDRTITPTVLYSAVLYEIGGMTPFQALWYVQYCGYLYNAVHFEQLVAEKWSSSSFAQASEGVRVDRCGVDGGNRNESRCLARELEGTFRRFWILGVGVCYTPWICFGFRMDFTRCRNAECQEDVSGWIVCVAVATWDGIQAYRCPARQKTPSACSLSITTECYLFHWECSFCSCAFDM